MIVTKPHTWLEVNKSAFDHNIATYRSLVGSGTQISVVVKSNAYGHGTREIGLLCEQNPAVDWICTASLSEALELRSYGISKPILVLSMVDEDPHLAAEYSIDLPVFDVPTAHEFNAIGTQLNKKITVHVKIDTGMTRYGLHSDTAVSEIQEIHALPFITIRGIFTSCAESGNPDQTFTLHQLEIFNTICKQLDELGIHIPFKHGANSAAASTVHTQFPLFNLVRLGAGAYGLWHFRDAQRNHPELNLQQLLSWKSRVTNIKTVPAGTCVGYDRTFITTRPTAIAIIPVGYQDGYDRRFTNKGIVLINGYYARVIGRICMNATLIEIPENQEVALGNEVILLGDYENLRAHDLAALIESHNAREITTRLAPAIKKIIINQEEKESNEPMKRMQNPKPQPVAITD